jgi:hypothetical protein
VRYSQRLAEAGLELSDDRCRDGYDTAPAETSSGLTRPTCSSPGNAENRKSVELTTEQRSTWLKQSAAQSVGFLLRG